MNSKALGTTVPRSVQLLQSLVHPDVQRDLALVSTYGGIPTEANADIPADDLAHLAAHGDEVARPSRTTPVSGSAGGGSA
ncbi:MAG: transporter [Modestobacter sp.]|jgi:hypothetical protein|nr:transporter [Modestobacter sp.]